MKKLINISLVVMLALTWACSSDISMENYSPPKLKTTVQCIFPQEAQEQGIEGEATVLVQIDDVGNVYKTDIAETSGYKILDLAALDYCNQLQFQPAKYGGNAIGSRIEMEVNFQYSDRQFNPNRYVFKTTFLLRKIENAIGVDKIALQNDLLTEHAKFIENMQNGIEFNKYSEDVLLPEITREWKSIWDSYPLTFLLYHDFLQRFPSYSDANSVKRELRSALQRDIFVIKNSRTFSSERTELKAALLIKIKSFTGKHYPEFDLKSLDTKMKNYTTKASY